MRPLNVSDGVMDATIAKERWPLFGTNLWAPLLIMAIACAAIVFEAKTVIDALNRAAADAGSAQGRATANEIAGLIAREHERLRAFVIEKEPEIRSLLSNADTDDWPAVEELQISLRRMFRGAISFTVVGPDGEPLFEDFDGLVGPVCEAEIAAYARAVNRGHEQQRIPLIHPIPGAYHFDLLSPWRLDSEKRGVFFVSMSPDRIAEVIAAAQEASGHSVYLVSRKDPSLIEVSARGSREQLGEAFRLDVQGLSDNAFRKDLPGTQWHLVVEPDQAALAESVWAVYRTVVVLIVGLLSIGALLLYIVRRAEQRNSSLFMRSLQSSVGRQRAILQSMVDGLVTIDAKGTILHVNNSITRLFGYKEKELIGANVSVLMPEPDRGKHDHYLENYMRTGEGRFIGEGREVLARRKDGTVFPILLTLGESFEGDQRVFVGILHDMTAYNEAQRKIIAQAMALQRSNQELDEISQIAAEHLQSPLSRIAALGDALGADSDGSISGEAREQIKTLADEVRDAGEWVKDLANSTRASQEIERHPVTLHDILEEVQRDLSERIENAGASVVLGTLPTVLCDRKQLRQLFWNLFDNALKFAAWDRAPEIRVEWVKDDAGDRRVIEVSDNGVGIPEKEVERVFDAFYRLQPRATHDGAGLGLAFCKRIVESAGGGISVRSRVGEGSVFRIVLPPV